VILGTARQVLASGLSGKSGLLLRVYNEAGKLDQVTGDRFRHGTTLRRWHPDKAPAQCTFAQLHAPIALTRGE
jgi:hypothetical protein